MSTEITTLNKEATNAVVKYNKALEGAKKSAWSVAKVVYETVRSNKFEEMFGSISNYAKAIGSCKATVSNRVNAYESYKNLPVDGDNRPALGLSYSQIVEMRKLDDNEKLDCIEFYDIDDKTTTKDVREFVKDYIELKAYDVEASEAKQETEAETEAERETSAGTGVMKIEYNGTEYTVTNTEVISDILNILKNLK